MGLFSGWFSGKNSGSSSVASVVGAGARSEVLNFNDPRFLEFVRSGENGTSNVLYNTTVFRCVSLIVNSIGMLPMRLLDKSSRQTADAHAMHGIVSDAPNGWQAPGDFKRQMQFWLLMRGNAYAYIVRDRDRVISLNPIDPRRVTPKQDADWSVSYEVTPVNGGDKSIIPAQDMLHLRGMSSDGLLGISPVDMATSAIELAKSADLAALRSFTNGVMAGGALYTDRTLGATARDNLRESLEARYAGPENANKWMVLEEGLKVERFANTAVDAEQTATRNHQVEAVGRCFGIPRPYLGMDDTSWGSGIEQLAIMFKTGALSPYFTAWEEGLARSCLTRNERKKYIFDFDERELLRGSMKDQADFLAKSAGSGGHNPWMTGNEIRDYLGLGPHADGDKLEAPGQQAVARKQDSNNEQA